MSVLDLDATTLSHKIKNLEMSSLEATEIYIQHLEKVNPHINCLVEKRYDLARQEAIKCDKLLKEGKASGRLFGVPISIKESFSVKGMHTTGGLVYRKDHLDEKDADVVIRLRAEGAIILGKTNTPTLCFCQETENKLYGRTNNPWNLSRTAGGSSGGEGALIAVGGATVGIGSDIGGSIRFPAHFNGVIGFKSGKRQISHEGHYPYNTIPLQIDMLGMGAIAKSVDDAALINEVISQQPPKEIDPSSFELIIPDEHPKYPLSMDTKKHIWEIKDYFNRLDRDVKEEYPSFFTNVALTWQLIMSINGAKDIEKEAFGGKPIQSVREYIKEVTTGESEIHKYLSWALIGAKLFKPTKKQLIKIEEDLIQAEQELESYLDRRVLILPVYHSTALPHGKFYAENFSIRKTYLKYLPYMALANLLGLPTLVVPVGTDQNGLPISVQLISKTGDENALFYYGGIIEEEFRGYLRCKAYDE